MSSLMVKVLISSVAGGLTGFGGWFLSSASSAPPSVELGSMLNRGKRYLLNQSHQPSLELKRHLQTSLHCILQIEIAIPFTMTTHR